MARSLLHRSRSSPISHSVALTAARDTQAGKVDTITSARTHAVKSHRSESNEHEIEERQI